MCNLKSAGLAALFGLAVAGFAGQLASASAEPVNPPAAKVYANNSDLSGRSSIAPAEAVQPKPQNKDAWGSQMVPGGSTGWDVRARTGFYGYR
jgi:hypothetical protein